MRRTEIKSLLILILCIIGFVAVFVLTAGLSAIVTASAVSLLFMGAALICISYRIFRSNLL
ncbi:MAG: hypothetical protein FWF78_10695 [Defluviitaleaceae bacterium]|nr:hypothetical protein [Defluviitaleaceae bacterium]